jgi:hypothetical protein
MQTVWTLRTAFLLQLEMTAYCIAALIQAPDTVRLTGARSEPAGLASVKVPLTARGARASLAVAGKTPKDAERVSFSDQMADLFLSDPSIARR